MNHSNDTVSKLRRTLILLALAVVLVITVDSIPFPTGNSEDVFAEDTQERTDDTSAEDTVSPPVALPESNQEHAGEPVHLTFLGECAPGSPYGTTAYGSLNALASQKGTAYFFAGLSERLLKDHLTVASNSCVFSDLVVTAPEIDCTAPTKNANIYADGSIEIAVNFANTDAFTGEDTKASFASAGLSSITPGELQQYTVNGIRIGIYALEITKETDMTPHIAEIQEAVPTFDFLAVYFRAGEDQSHMTETWLVSAAHKMAEAGASLIVGAGCGVLRPYEYYGNSLIAYSLGSIVDGGHLVTENAAVLLQVELATAKNGQIIPTYTWVPCFVYGAHWQPAIMTEKDDIDRVLFYLAGEIPLPVPSTTD